MGRVVLDHRSWVAIARLLHGTSGASGPGEPDPVSRTFRLSGVVLTHDVTLAGAAEEIRHREIAFTLRGGQLIAQGVSAYPDSLTEVAANRPVVIAIVGGNGDYIGARGEVTTSRKANGTYRHVITLLR